MRRNVTSVLLHALLLLLAAATLLPLAWTVAASLSPAGEAFRGGLTLLPRAPTWEHYATLFRRLDLARATWNSALLALSVTAVSLLLNSMAGYAFAKLRFSGRDRLFRTLLAALVIPAQVAMLPLFLLAKELGLVNSYAGVIVPAAASVFGIFLMRQYALSIPDSLLDAARIDGGPARTGTDRRPRGRPLPPPRRDRGGSHGRPGSRSPMAPPAPAGSRSRRSRPRPPPHTTARHAARLPCRPRP